MADRRDYYFRQKVTEAELDDGFDGLEKADRAFATDTAVRGVVSGQVVVQHSAVPNLSVDVSAGSAYDPDGQRMSLPSLQNVSVATDSNNVSTSVATPGNEKWVSIFLKFDRSLSDPRTDGNSLNVYFVRAESFEFEVVQGAEAAIGLAVRPTLLTDGVLLADVNRTNGQTQILNADISTSRREDHLVVSGTPLSFSLGTTLEALQEIADHYNGHVNGTDDTHLADAIHYAGGGSWAGGTSPTNPATDVETQLDKVITDLAATTSSASGSHRIGSASISGSPSISAGTLYSQLQALKLAANLEYAGGGSWAGGTSATNPAATVEAQLDKVITDLASTTSGASGAHRIGSAAIGSNSGGNLHSVLSAMDGRIGYKDTAQLWTGAQTFDRLLFNSTAAGLELRVISQTDANHTLSAINSDIHEVPALASDRIWTLDKSVAPIDGRVLWVIREAVDESNKLDIKNGSGGPVLHTFTANMLGSAQFYAIGGDWKRGFWTLYTP